MDNVKGNIIKGIFLNSLIIVLAIVIFKSVSYSIDNDPTVDNKDLFIETGNMQVVLNVPKDQYVFTDSLKLSVPDSVGMNQEGYTFTLTNTGNIPIDYYEIRILDEENEISTLPHNYLRFVINKDRGNYSEVKNLGDVDSIIYQGSELGVSQNASFNLKLWIDEREVDIYNKELHAALEVTLYQKNDIYEKYVLYESDGGYNIPLRTSIYSPISSAIPRKDGYKFLGWSTSFNGEVKYLPGDTFKEIKGVTIYAIWEKESVN